MYFIPKNFAAEACDRKVSFIVNFSFSVKVLTENGYVISHSTPIVFYRLRGKNELINVADVNQEKIKIEE